MRITEDIVSRPRAVAVVAFGILECALFGYILDGWPSLDYLLKADGVYSFLCWNPDDTQAMLNSSSALSLSLRLAGGLGSMAPAGRRTLPLAFSAGRAHAATSVFASASASASASAFTSASASASTFAPNQSVVLDALMWHKSTSSPDHSDHSLSNASGGQVVGAQGQHHYAPYMAYGNGSDSSGFPTCPDQANILNAAYFLSNFVGQGSSALLGFLFDGFGLRICRLLAVCLFASGCLMMSFTNIAYSWLIFPGTMLIGTSGMLFIISATHVTLLAGNRQSTTVAVMSACIDISAFITAFMQLAYDAGGISRSHSFYFYTGLAVFPLLNTIFLSPAYKVADPQSPAIYSAKFTNDDLSLEASSSSSSSLSLNQVVPVRPFHWYALSWVYALHVLWFAIGQLRFWFLLGSLNSWLEILTGHNIVQVDQLTLDFQYIHLLGFLMAPLVGLLTDWLSNKTEKEIQDAESRSLISTNERNMEIKRGTSLVPALLLSCLAATLLSISALFWTTGASYAVSLFTVALKAFMYSTHLAFCQRIYPTQHYGKLIGIAITIGCVIDTVEIPFFLWAQNSIPPFSGANITLLTLVAISFVHPLHIWIANKFIKS